MLNISTNGFLRRFKKSMPPPKQAFLDCIPKNQYSDYSEILYKTEYNTKYYIMQQFREILIKNIMA